MEIDQAITASSSLTVPEHGGDVYQSARALGKRVSDMVDFSANINPLGFPAGIPAALLTALAEVVHYPDHQATDLRRELAAYHDLSPDQVIVGNGSTELIYLAVRALKPRKGLIVAPAFSEYEKALTRSGAEIAWRLTAEAEGFTLTGPIDPQGADLVFMANPASPSGALVPPARLAALVARWIEAGCYVLLDEAFIDFVEEASLKTRLGDLPRLLILRSFTKFFGIPGIRLGYVLAAPELVEHLRAAQEPWSVGALALAAGRSCLADQEFIAQTRRLVPEARERLRARLQAINGLEPLAGAANYLLVKLTHPQWQADRLRRALLEKGLLIRDASNFKGLDERFFRVAVRSDQENARLLTALQECLGNP